VSGVFPRVAIVGVGLIGGSLGMALKNRRLAQTVVGVGRETGRLEIARDLGAIDDLTTDLAAGVYQADLVVLATPVPQILADLPRLASLLSPGAIVTDVGSTKEQIVRAGDDALPAGAFVAGHPMAGSERSGVEAAHAELFIEATWALTPTAQTDENALARVRALAQAVGARTLVLDPNAHDRAVAVTSHLPHVLAYALAALAGEAAKSTPHLYDLAAGSFASATRVAGSSPDLWQGIALSNRDALADALRAFRSDLDATLAALESGDASALLEAFARGFDAKQSASSVSPQP